MLNRVIFVFVENPKKLVHPGSSLPETFAEACDAVGFVQSIHGPSAPDISSLQKPLG